MASRIVSIGYTFFGVGMVIMNAFNNAGDQNVYMDQPVLVLDIPDSAGLSGCNCIELGS